MFRFFPSFGDLQDETVAFSNPIPFPLGVYFPIAFLSLLLKWKTQKKMIHKKLLINIYKRPTSFHVFFLTILRIQCIFHMILIITKSALPQGNCGNNQEVRTFHLRCRTLDTLPILSHVYPSCVFLKKNLKKCRLQLGHKNKRNQILFHKTKRTFML